jgi:crossover junction endodeoxyribonuclease RuvC
MLIFGVDPGTAAIGYGLVKAERGKECALEIFGCIETSPRRTTAERLGDLYEALTALIKKYRPDVLAVEDIFFFKNLKTAVKVSQARGVILLAGQKNHLLIYEYTPLQVKQALTGYGRAEKKQIQQMVKSVLRLKEAPQPDDAADALAVAICCAHSKNWPRSR